MAHQMKRRNNVVAAASAEAKSEKYRRISVARQLKSGAAYC